jgi:EmrB/QacA subfamily drug resistance transporter
MRRIEYKWVVLVVVASGTFLNVLNQTIMNVALPRIMAVFGAGIDQAQLVLTGFMLAGAIVMPATPFLSDRLGAKRLFLITVGLFTIGSLLCGLAWSIPSLVAARVLQGLGGGMIMPLGMAMIFRVTPPDQRGTMMSIWAMPVMLGPILGPTLGGFLVEYVGWRWVFFINLPVGALAVALGALLLREMPGAPGRRFDMVGFVLAALCSSGALLGLSRAPTSGWDDSLVVGLLALAAVTLPIFIWWELRTPAPLLNLRLFAIPDFAIGGVVNFVATVSMFGAIFLVPVFLQNVRGMGPMQTGLILVPQALASTVSIIIGGRLYDRFGPRPLVLAGLVIMAAATFPLAQIDVTTPDATLLWLLALRGGATGFLMMPAITAWLASAPASQTSAASALNNVMRQLFSTFATAVFASILQARIGFHHANLAMFVAPDAPAVARLLGQAQQFALEHGLSVQQGKALAVAQLAGQVRQAAAVRGFEDCFLIAGIVCVLGIVPALFLKQPGRAAARPQPPAAVPARPQPAASAAVSRGAGAGD